MAVKIRMKRIGKKGQPYYRVVVADSRTKRDGRVIEEVGYYNPNTQPADISIKEERVLEWLAKGAQPTVIARNLLKKTGTWAKFAEGKK
ncbi:MAG TPA: 30S ribosomal protein S16 [Candidatus Mcinerneyibacteriales bacterium]|jgi:small subunit ribosomal protein S16|nr:30S ribosomal protein S16 [Candidatus Mcinerneyibacteriota bacterium]HOO58995.1 30S ribosomal protein S16 [Candidatus Mcinerneyibacteriales bacterium]HPE20675.1 30S ribosomal protein S16 [Candidatus Mcinerneyibacteriales bacterium]HPJ70086.1 30S ribosomal protein S16 [Candidatus Mcinerneyibacteriales bacterium]HPQ89699.1 30S ribosomal protein S16 [Candidatus Mcinerneyibacteriales bacterium]